MIKYKEIKKMETKKVLINVVCDVCKKKYLFHEDEMEIQEFQHINFVGGYSSIFGDDVGIECDICQHCLKKLIGEYCREQMSK